MKLIYIDVEFLLKKKKHKICVLKMKICKLNKGIFLPLNFKLSLLI